MNLSKKCFKVCGLLLVALTLGAVAAWLVQPANVVPHLMKVCSGMFKPKGDRSRPMVYRVHRGTPVSEVVAMMDQESGLDHPKLFWAVEKGKVVCASLADTPVSPLSQSWYYLVVKLSGLEDIPEEVITEDRSPGWKGIVVEVSDSSYRVHGDAAFKPVASVGEATAQIMQQAGNSSQVIVLTRSHAKGFFPILELWQSLELQGLRHKVWQLGK